MVIFTLIFGVIVFIVCLVSILVFALELSKLKKKKPHFTSDLNKNLEFLDWDDIVLSCFFFVFNHYY
jgi:hypothetical protein